MGRRAPVVIFDDTSARSDQGPEESSGTFLSPSRIPIWFSAIALSPILLPLYFIWRYGVNFIWNDEWDMADILVAAHRGVASWTDFWRLHNEHRMVIPFGIMYALARLTKYNVRVEMVFGTVTMSLTAVFVGMLLQSTRDTENEIQLTGRRRIPAWGWKWLCVTPLILSVMQYENFLFGFGSVQNFLPMACFTAAMALIYRRGVNWLTLLGAALLIECATLSLANGLLGWVMMIPILCAVDRWPELVERRMHLIAWLVLSAFGIGTFFIGYQNNRWADWYYVATPWTRIEYFFIFLGQSLAYGTFSPGMSALVTGVLLFLLFLGCVCYLIERVARGKLSLVKRALPWVVLGSYSICCAAMGARGRAGIGLMQASNSRYTTISIYLVICIVLVVPMVLRDLKQRNAIPWIVARYDAILISLRAAICIGFLLSTCWSFAAAYQWYREKTMGRAHLAFIRFIDEPNRQALVTDHTNLRDAAITLDEMGYIHPPLINDSDMSKLARDVPKSDAGRYGAAEGIQQLADGTINIWGWAALDHPQRPADAVVIAYNASDGAVRCCALADVLTVRADVVKKTKNPLLQVTGWTSLLPMSRLPKGPLNLQCFAYDAERQQLFLISPPNPAQ